MRVRKKNQQKTLSQERLDAGKTSGVLILFVIGIWGAFTLGYDSGYKTQFKEKVVNALVSVPKDNKAKPKLDLNTAKIDKILDEIVELDGEKPSLEFEQVMNDIYKEIIINVADNYGFSDSKKRKLMNSYSKFSQEVVQNSFDELKQLSKARKKLPTSSFIDVKHYQAADDFHAVLSDQICFVTNTVATFAHLNFGDILINSDVTNFTLKKSCSYILRVPTFYLVKVMKKQGLIKDVIESKRDIEEHTRIAVLELATAEDTVVETNTDNIIKKVWIFRSDAKLSIRVKSIVKAGFELDENFEIEIDPNKEIIYVTLPRAKILANSITPEVLEDRNGLWARTTKEVYNEMYTKFEKNTTQTAIKRGILEEAEKNAKEQVRNIYLPLISLSGSSFDVKVRFAEK